MSRVSVLVADDFEPWQRFVVEKLRQRRDVRAIGWACHGLEAIQKAEELQPDLILLDVNLPQLNGIEAAREIRSRAPTARILFLSSSSDADVVSAAFNAGGRGFILKFDAGEALFPGMGAVLRGNRFVSSSVIGIDHLTDA